MMIPLPVILIVVGVAILSFSLIVVPIFMKRLNVWHEKRETYVRKELDLIFQHDPSKILRLYYIIPPLLGFAAYFVTRNLVMCVIGVVIGLLIPGFLLKMRRAKRLNMFQKQLPDTLRIITSSLKGGLSLLQSMESVVEEMPVPVSQEFGLLLRENKIGVPFEESLVKLLRRMPSDDLELFINSLLVAKETGGNLPRVIARLTDTIRDRQKLKEKVKTLTLQGKIQGIIMAVIPILFASIIRLNNKEHFDILFTTVFGKKLIIAAIVLYILGLFLLKKMSEVKI